MKIMIVTGGANSIWTKLFIEKVLLPLGAEIYIQKSPLEDDRYDDFYKESAVNYVCNYRINKAVIKIPKLGGIYHRYIRKKALKLDMEFDYVVVIFGNPFYLKCAKKIMTNKTKLIVWYIGSDLLRITHRKKCSLVRLTKLLKPTNVCVNHKIGNAFKSLIDEKGCDWICDFGISSITNMTDFFDKKFLLKESFLKINPDLYTIAIGYNACSAQQHSLVLKSLLSLNDSVKSKICLILPMTYHGDKKYIDSIKRLLTKSGFVYLVFEKFMDSNEMGKLWCSVDMFIHAQTTDALSASMLEAIYAGCVILNGSWLKYSELEEWGISVQTFSRFSEIPDIVTSNLLNKAEYNSVSRKLIYDYASWDACINKWKEILN